MQYEVFSLNLALKYVRSFYIQARSTEPGHAEPNQGLNHQIM